MIEIQEDLNKIYFFEGKWGDYGVFVGAKTWRKARNTAIYTDELDGVDFVDIRGHVCKVDKKICHTNATGILDAHHLLEAGYTSFWWTGDCEKCGTWHEMLHPSQGKMLCYDCDDSKE